MPCCSMNVEDYNDGDSEKAMCQSDSIPSIKVDMLQLGKYLNIQGKELWKNLTLDHHLLQ